MQFYNLDKRTRVKLSNHIGQMLEIYRNYTTTADLQDFFKKTYDDVFCQTLEIGFTINIHDFFENISFVIINAPYDDVLTLIEALVELLSEEFKKLNSHYNSSIPKNIYELTNKLFEQEYVGYRFIDNIIAPISDEVEVAAVNEVLESEFAPVNEHIEKSLKLLSDRGKPDYENSIKESISAVEAMCEVVTGIHGKKATLGQLLKKLAEKGINIHPCLKDAFDKLYGYTCDANGLRHAGNIGGPSATFEEAKFMLVSCSAFVNYLKSNMAD